ncbi:MAG: polyprenyl synthetase family protein [Chloroflexi bacterium]|nr:polyprenyl synthetase family protein [Chloroflexota bacterium]
MVKDDGAQQSHRSSDLGTKLPGMFSRYQSSVEQGLYAAVPGAENFEAHRLLRYHLGWVDELGGPMDTSITQGKALRPTLCLFACNALADDYSKALPAAAAVELIHNFSLIHDDIQDQDVERRHHPTVWHLWGIPKALWSGNAMQCTGDLSLLEVAGQDATPSMVLQVSEILTESYLEMIQGQCLDLEFESRTDVKSDEYLYMIACKTGALIRCALEIGALLATEDAAAVRAFAEFGDHLGRVFQIRDDYLGIWGDQATLGKATDSDIRRRKKSYPVVFALEQASGRAMEDLLRIYGQEELKEDDVQRVLAVLDEVGSQEHSQRLTEAAAARALEALKPVSLPQWAQTEAEELVDFLARREY